MKTVCLYFELGLPVEFRRYRFFDIGKEHYYLDAAAQGAAVRKAASRSLMPMCELLQELDIKVSVGISGLTIEALREFTPEVLVSLKGLVEAGKMEILGGTYSDSLASLRDRAEFESQVREHSSLVEREFGVKPTAFRNTALIYSDSIGEMVASLGFRAMVAEGARHVLGWRSPNLVYASAGDQHLKLLLRNWKVSDTQYIDPIAHFQGDVLTLGLGFEPFDFLRQIPALADLQTQTVSVAVGELHPAGGVLSCPYPMSWTGEERDVTPWTGNELQEEALRKLYALRSMVETKGSADLRHVFNILQNADIFAAMSTTRPEPYDAFINYMNIISDFELELR